MTRRLDRWQGLRALVQDAVEHGSRAVEEVHKATAARTFLVLEAIPPVAAPSKAVHVLHDASLSFVYGSIRLVNRAVGKAVEVGIEVADASRPPDSPDSSDERRQA